MPLLCLRPRVIEFAMRLPLLLLASSLGIGIHAAEIEQLRLIQTIPLPGVKGRFDHFAVDAKGGRLFVAALGNNTLEVIDLATSQRTHSISGLSKPTGVLFLSTASLVLVANGGDGTLKILDGATYKFLRTAIRLPDADNLRPDPETKFA